MKYIKTLTIMFDTEINQKEIPLLRGAVLKKLGDNANILFHNHLPNNTFRYSYPLIQYKRIFGKAAIVCIEDGVNLIGQFLSSLDGPLLIGKREIELNTNRIQPARLLVQTWDNSFSYQINRWLPLNSKNLVLYQALTGDVERIAFLENILKANLLSMLKGLDIYLEQEIVVNISQVSEPFYVYNKGVKMVAFNADFTSNLSIPNNLGIGKNASIGCGVVHQMNSEHKQ